MSDLRICSFCWYKGCKTDKSYQFPGGGLSDCHCCKNSHGGKVELDQINDMFNYHAPSSDKVRKLHEDIRYELNCTAKFIFDNVPHCDERDKAVDRLREAMFYANAAVAIYGNNNE